MVDAVVYTLLEAILLVVLVIGGTGNCHQGRRPPRDEASWTLAFEPEDLVAAVTKTSAISA